MRFRTLALIAAVGTMVAVALVVLVQLVGTPLVPPSETPTASPLPPVATVPASPDPTDGMHWNDPSVDPAVLKKAFAPPSRPLPADALPQPSQIRPSRDELKRMQRRGAVAY